MPPPLPDRLLAGLTPEQTRAVCHGPGVLLIVAGPGAGKTRVLIHRIAWLLAQGLAEPREILAVTFSVRAAGELRLRLAEFLGPEVAARVSAATFHSVCARLVRDHCQVFGRGPNWTIYTEVELRKVVDWVLSDQRRIAIQRGVNDFGQPPSAEVLREISLAKNRLLTPESYEEAGGHPAAPLIAAVWCEVEAELRRSNALGFDDLLVCAVRLLAEQPHYLQLYRQRYRWILVDEYQDTCQAQAMLVSLLATRDGNLAVVADDDQCLVAGTQISMADGTRRPIERVQPGDLVLSAYGGGRLKPSRVLRVKRSRRTDGIEIMTASGRRVCSTAEHMHFAGYRLGLTPQMQLTYVMHRKGRGFRLGTTSIYTKGQQQPILGLCLRSVQEHADAAWVVSVHKSQKEARVAELVLSLRYGLPLLPFVARRGARLTGDSIVEDQDAIDRVFDALETESAGLQLLADHGLSFDHPHHVSQSAEGRRRIVTVRLCAHNGAHRVTVSGWDQETANQLRGGGYGVRHDKKTSPNHWQVSVQSIDMGDVLAHAERIRCLIGGGRVRLMGGIGGANTPGNVSLPFMPASAVRPGMVMATDEVVRDLVEI
ncbi:MAG: UvrD-helicase domain-containing protein [Solirubrobacteraceae bacterium]